MQTYQAPLPSAYAELNEAQLDASIVAAKRALGNRAVILGHHYQRDAIIRHADYVGDSYKLAKDAGGHPEAEYIVFCGVHFMAESADILTPASQTVVLPNMAAGCSMADMASIMQVRAAWKQLEGLFGNIEPGVGSAGIVPITYINSSAALKAFVGEHGGTACTSSNADRAMRWALDRGDKLLFFPDQHLGRNTAHKLGFDVEADALVWDPHKPLGGNSEADLKHCRFLLWKGHCSVHQRFNLQQIRDARVRYPDVNVIVHPECPLEVVQASDFSGSTEQIIRAVRAGSPGSVWAVGTEINLVSRLSRELPDRTIFCLDPQICPCSTMYRIHPSFLSWTLESLADGRAVNVVRVPDRIREFALKSLERMLEI